MSIDTDAQGNLYVTGTFSGKVLVGADTLNSQGNMDFFLARYSSSGQLLWAKQFGGTGMDWADDIGCDSAGNCYLTGRFNGQMHAGSVTLTADSTDGFIIRTDPSGNVVWANGFGGSIADKGTSVYVDKLGRCYLAGTFGNTMSLGTYTFSHMPNPERHSAFAALLDTTGQVLWATRALSTNWNATESRHIASDDSGNVFLTGTSLGLAIFGDLQIGEDNIVGFQHFLVKFGPNGIAQWGKGGTSNWSNMPMGLTTDAEGNCYTTGSFDSGMGFAGESFNGTNGFNYYVAKLNPAGQVVFARSATNADNGDTGFGEGGVFDLALDHQGNTLISGWFSGHLVIGSDTLVTSFNSQSPFIACYNGSGTALWAKRLTSTSAPEFAAPYGIDTHTDGSIYATGYFQGSTLFGAQTLTSTGASDMFLLKMQAPITAAYSVFSEKKMELLPNPAAGQANIRYNLKSHLT